MTTEKFSFAPVPNTWTWGDWPPDVYPFNGTSGKRLIHKNEMALLKAGALTRVGHKMIVMGPGYMRWMALQAVRVNSEYEVPANRPQHAPKRFGGGLLRGRAGPSVTATAKEIAEATRPVAPGGATAKRRGAR
jgi:hypothetical protein